MKSLYSFLIITLFTFNIKNAFAQEEKVASGQVMTQSVKGKIIDKQSKFPLIGVNVVILNLDPPLGATTDESGEFKIARVPIGRQAIKISYLGYKEQVIPNILLTSGKEIFLNIELEEQILESEEVVVYAEKDKAKTQNEMATVSARSFTIEETSRYAGSFNDPARMAMNFAGVSGTNDSRNDIIIRGNSPLGVLWRIEGVDIPSPNHFGTFGTTGGPISMLNYNTLSNSDFMTSAFPAQYGNALSGVFDLQMRRGNQDKREYMFQAGLNGLEAGLEGPISKKARSSYLVNYRYSTLGVFNALGINFGTSATPYYQDLSFKADFPVKSKGKFTVFGIGGLSHIDVLSRKVDTTDLYSVPGENSQFKSNMGVIGTSYMHFLDNTSYVKFSYALSATSMLVVTDSIQKRDNVFRYDLPPIPSYRNHFSQVKNSANFLFNKKFSARNTLNAGFIYDLYNFNIVDSVLVRFKKRIDTAFYSVEKFYPIRNFNGATSLFQAFTQWQHRFTEQVTLNAGLHYQYLFLNKTWALEPRMGVKYQFKERQSLNFGYGLHSQLQPFQAYFREDTTAKGETIRTNINLGFTKSHQFVLGYENSLGNNLRLKIETYYQYIFNAPVERNPSSFSLLNSGADFGIETKDSLINNGKGRNYGLELTFEKFYSNNYYFLFTTSLYDSRYLASDGIWRSTAFNGHYVFNLLGGKEFKIGGRSALVTDLKITYAGGRRYTPVDIEQSIAQNTEVRIHEVAFSGKLKDYFRTDFKVSYRLNGKKLSQEWVVNIQNIFNTQNAFIQRYSVEKQRLIIVPQMGIFPVAQYKVTF